MNDPHKNIFYYYRGPSKRETEEIIYDSQVEDNTTKAFINCLEYCGNDLLKHFLIFFNLNFKFESKPQFLLQVSKTKSRPDAQIKTLNSSLYIESKVIAGINKEQLRNHLKELDKDDTLLLITANTDEKINKNKNLLHINWSDIHKCFSKYEPKNKTEKFIISQFTNYLEVIGLSDFTGFNNDDFDYFINRIDDYKPVVKNKIDKFGKGVYGVLSEEIKSIYTDRHLGIAPKNTEAVWFGIRKDQNTKDVFRHCNFTVEINSDAINFYTVIRDGRYSDKNGPIGIFYKKIKNNFDEFLAILKSLSQEYFFRISKRVPRRGKKIMPGNEKWVPLSVLTLEIVTDETIDYILMLLKKIEFPGVHIGLSIKRGDEILKKPELLIEKGKNVIEEEYKVLKFLEN